MAKKTSTRPRNELGWRIPREGTVARHIFDLTMAGAYASEIAIVVNREPAYVRFVIWRFQNPEIANVMAFGKDTGPIREQMAKRKSRGT